jgi:lipoate-protein ligase A
MILWCDGAHGAVENMRRDAALLERAADGRLAGPLLRLFRFAPPGITLGRSQVPARELDLSRTTADGIEWTVRPTGGRAIFHEHEWTFSLATPLARYGWAETPSAAYERTCALLRHALLALGVPVELSPGTARGVGAPRVGGGPAAPCFASAARHELTLAGGKLAGIAQRAVRGALLQQGSVLLGEGHLRLASYLALPREGRAGAHAALAAASAHAGAYLPAGEPLESLADAIASHCPGARRVDGEAGIAWIA